MGMSTGGNKGGVQSDINVTPLIDVLLVLLIIFLLVMPIMMRNEALQIPRKIDDKNETVDNNMTQITVLVKDDLSIIYKENDKEEPPMNSWPELKAKLDARLPVVNTGENKVVFVDFEDGVQWKDVVQTMDTIRALANDDEHDNIKVALKVREAKDAEQPAP